RVSTANFGFGLSLSLRKWLKDILSNPNMGKPLRYTLKGFRAIRIGKYRLIYAIEGDAVKVYAIEHRKKVYE
ncbi:hypothetical protein C5S31_01260, partial [ANME-1 cluster archaeon GoMg2]|nr:hypothetical protein [ANME-1 cluster archaeon GoMg2]